MSSLVFPTLLGMTVLSRERVDNVSIFETASGKEQRLGRWAAPRYRYKLGFGGGFLRSAAAYAELQALENFAGRHRGRFDSFLWSDPEDSSVIDHGFGVGDGATTAFQIQRTIGGAVYDALGGPWAISSKPSNLLLRSQQLDNASWAKTGAALPTVTADAAGAPDGTLTADRISGGTAAAHSINQNVAVAAGTQYTFSFFAKNNGGTAARYSVYDVTHSADIVSASFFGSISSTWTRIPVTFTTPAGCTSINVYPDRDTTGEDLFVWGLQLEPGATATLYRPTTSSSARPAYWPATGDGFEPVNEPAPGPLVYVNGALKSLGTDYTLGANGAITFTSAPASGAVLSWSGSYWKRVRFDSDSMSAERVLPGLWKSGVDLVSVL